MKMTLTERDKKLLVVLLIVAIIAGLGFGVLRPIMAKSAEVQTELESAKAVKEQNEIKVQQLPTLKTQLSTTESTLAAVQEEFYPVMASMSVDKLLTEMALRKNLSVYNLGITVPPAAEYTSLANYQGALSTSVQSMADGTAETTYSGMQTAAVSMTVNGSRENMQALLDACMANEPGMQVLAYQWQQNASDSEETSLTFSLSIYMYEDIAVYTQEIQAAAAAAAKSGTVAETDSME